MICCQVRPCSAAPWAPHFDTPMPCPKPRPLISTLPVNGTDSVSPRLSAAGTPTSRRAARAAPVQPLTRGMTLLWLRGRSGARSGHWTRSAFLLCPQYPDRDAIVTIVPLSVHVRTAVGQDCGLSGPAGADLPRLRGAARPD